MRILPVLLPALLTSGLCAVETVTIDVATGRHPIDPRIYGVAWADAQALSDLRAPLNRWGGNTTTRYNWQQNAENKGSDWYYQSIAGGSATAGADADAFVQRCRDGGSLPMLTIPMIGWVAKVGSDRSKRCSFSIAKYGAQSDSDWQWFPDAGNGLRSTGGAVTGNDPNDANVANSTSLQQGWLQHLVGRWGNAGAGGIRYYFLDNEPSLWNSTHRDVQPTGLHMNELRDQMIAYATLVKSQDPAALVLGPEEWGWTGYFYSGYDAQWASSHGWAGPFPDRSANGGGEYLPWLLAQMHQASTAAGKRLLDVFSVHYYPQGGEYSDDVSAAMQARRNRSTRSLWDPTYTDETWINDKVQLIPRLKQWVAAGYPDTPIGLTEYNWGAENHINGATAQADVYGIFGREGLDIGNRWTTPAATTPTYKAMKLYRNYDGSGSSFGETSVRAVVADPDRLAAFAAERTDGALTVMLVHKATAALATNVALTGFTPGTAAQVWQLTASNAITRLTDAPITGAALSLTLPAQSITLLVMARDGVPNHAPTITTAKPATVTVLEDTAGSISLHASDADGDVLTWSIQTPGSKGTANVDASGPSVSLNYIPTANANGSDTVVVQVADGRGGSDTISVNLTITAVNDAPQVQTPIPDQSATVGTAFSYVLPSTIFRDADGDTLTYAVSGLPTWLTYTAATRTFSGTPSAADTVTVTVTASDPANASVADSFILTASSAGGQPSGSSGSPAGGGGCGLGGGLAAVVTGLLFALRRR